MFAPGQPPEQPQPSPLIDWRRASALGGRPTADPSQLQQPPPLFLRLHACCPPLQRECPAVRQSKRAPSQYSAHTCMLAWAAPRRVCCAAKVRLSAGMAVVAKQTGPVGVLDCAEWRSCCSCSRSSAQTAARVRLRLKKFYVYSRTLGERSVWTDQQKQMGSFSPRSPGGTLQETVTPDQL